jgi:Heterokaryon incompatibility protein (HET)
MVYNNHNTDIGTIAPNMFENHLEPYRYNDLPTQTSFRVIELLPGEEGNPVSCLLHVVDWSNPLEYEAISYAWGDPNARAEVSCHGKGLEVTHNPHRGLKHLRSQNRSRFLWADALW